MTLTKLKAVFEVRVAMTLNLSTMEMNTVKVNPVLWIACHAYKIDAQV